MNKQIEAVRRQAAALGLRLQPWGPAPPPAFVDTPAFACPPIPDESVSPILEGASKAQSVDVGLLRAVIDQESAFHPCAVSSKGAQGLMQLMPEVASRFGVKDVFDPKQNVEAGAQYLKEQTDGPSRINRRVTIRRITPLLNGGTASLPPPPPGIAPPR